MESSEKLRSACLLIFSKIHFSTNLCTREVDTHSAVPDCIKRDLEVLARDAADDDVALPQGVFHRPPLDVLDKVRSPLDALAAREALHGVDVDAVHAGAVVCEQSGEGAADNFRTIHDGDGAAEQAVAVCEVRVVDGQVVEDLDDGERRAGQDGLLRVGGRVEEARVLVEVEDVRVPEPLDVLGRCDDVLQVLVLPRVEDGVVDDDAVDGGVSVCGDERVFDGLFRYAV